MAARESIDASAVCASVAVFQPHHVVEVRRGHLEHQRVLELDPPLVHVDDLVLAPVELEAQLLALLDEEHLAAVALSQGVYDLVAPRLLHSPDRHGETVEVEQVGRELAHTSGPIAASGHESSPPDSR